MNVLKQHQQSTVFTLLELKKSQREIHRITGIVRKTIRRHMAIFAARASTSANSPAPATIGSEDTDQTPPLPRPPAFQAALAKACNFDFARSLCEPHRQWIEEQVRLQRNAQGIYQDLVDQYVQPRRSRLGRLPRRQHHEQHDPGPTHASLPFA